MIFCIYFDFFLLSRKLMKESGRMAAKQSISTPQERITEQST